MMPRWVAWLGAAISVALIIVCVAALTGCQGVNSVGCPAGKHAVPTSGGFKCKGY